MCQRKDGVTASVRLPLESIRHHGFIFLLVLSYDFIWHWPALAERGVPRDRFGLYGQRAVTSASSSFKATCERARLGTG